MVHSKCEHIEYKISQVKPYFEKEEIDEVLSVIKSARLLKDQKAKSSWVVFHIF